MQLTSVTFAYPHVPGSIRADLATRIAGKPLPDESFLLSTCLRIELTVLGDLSRLERVAAGLFGEAAVIQRGTVRTDRHALEHLFRVAAGLESPIVGEREILSQFRHALNDAENEGTVRGLLAKVLESAVSVAKQVRSVLPDSPHDSMAAVAAQLVGAADRVAVLGAGAMGRAVIESLRALPAPPKITLIVRSPDNVRIAGVDVASMELAGDALETWPAVVSATSASGRLVPDAEVARILARRTAMLTLVDLAMPPDLNPPSTGLIQHFDIDDIARRSQRRVDTTEAATQIEAAATEVYRLVDAHHEIGPVIGALMQSADAVVARTVERFAGRLANSDDRAVLHQTAHTVARTLVAGPVSYLRSTDRPPETLDMMAEAFGLEDRS